MGCRCRRDEVGWLGVGRGRGSGQRAAGAVCGTLAATPETRYATSRENENEDCAGDQDNRSVGQKMSDAARQVVGPLEEWADGGVAGNLEEFCWVFWDDERIWRLSETRKRNGLLVPLWPSGPSPRATDRDPEPVCAPPTSSQPAADCCLRQPSGPAVWAARTHRPSQAGARHMKSRTGLAIWFALHPIKRVFPVSARRCLGFSTARRADGKLDNTHISKIGKSVGLDLGYGDSTLCIHGLFRRLISFRLGTLATMPSRGPAATGAPPPPDPALPSIYTDFRALLDEKVSPGRFVNVIGVVKDCRLPVPTGGTGELKLPIPILTH